MEVRDYIAHETDRQTGDIQEAIGMYLAHDLMVRWTVTPRVRRKSFENIILSMARLLNGAPGYRKVPAVFNQGMPALNAQLIPHAMKCLGEAMDAEQDDNLSDEDRATFYTREFLLIHPFADGNGRIGSLIWNYWMSTLDNPEPMPYFFGKDNK